MTDEVAIPTRSEPSPEGLSIEDQGRMAADPLTFPKFIPLHYVGKIGPNHWCRGWNSKREKYCQHQAGYNTDHKGVGRCHIHGGLTPVKRGTYSDVTTGKLQEHLTRLMQMETAVRLDLGPELNMMRALAMDYVENYDELVQALIAWNAQEKLEAVAEERKPKPQRIPTIHEVSDLLVKISNIVDKAHKQLHRDSIPKNEFFRLQQAMGESVRKHIMAEFQRRNLPEDDAKRLTVAITDDWLEIEL